MNYYSTFIQIAADCPVKMAVIPVVKNGQKSVPVFEYELLSAKPYFYTQEELLFEVHVRRKSIAANELKSRRQELWREFFYKPHACLRASSLPKKYGWGIHFNIEGKIALVPMESKEYQRLVKNESFKQLLAMRSQRER